MSHTDQILFYFLYGNGDVQRIVTITFKPHDRCMKLFALNHDFIIEIRHYILLKQTLRLLSNFSL